MPRIVIGRTHFGASGPPSGVALAGFESQLDDCPRWTRSTRWFGAGGRLEAQDTFERRRPGGASIRFHPKSWASTDQRPGPNSARAAPTVPVMRPTNGSGAMVSTRAISMTATAAPAKGVQSPAMRRSPDAARDADVSIVYSGGSPHRREPARMTRTEPTTRRKSSNPVPGQLPANVEYRRRNPYQCPLQVSSLQARNKTPDRVQVVTLSSLADRSGMAQAARGSTGR
jgi:hypothetical protein